MANIVKGNKITVQGGLHARLASQKMMPPAEQINPTTLPNRIAIVGDLSGSMDSSASGRWDSQGSSKLTLLKDAVQDFSLRSDNTTTAIAFESFPQGFRIDLTADKNEVWMKIMSVRTLGDTPMGSGMRAALESHSPTRCVLISDGEATDGEESYKAAHLYRERELICDCVHIGASTAGEERLKKIAEITGGMFMKFTNVSSFAENFHYLLPGEREAIAGMLPYDIAKLLGADEVK